MNVLCLLYWSQQFDKCVQMSLIHSGDMEKEYSDEASWTSNKVGVGMLRVESCSMAGSSGFLALIGWDCSLNAHSSNVPLLMLSSGRGVLPSNWAVFKNPFFKSMSSTHFYLAV